MYWKSRHIKGHKDDGNKYNNIDEWGRSNIEADRITKDFLWRQIHAGAKNNPHKDISRAIQPTTMEYHNITYTIKSQVKKKYKDDIKASELKVLVITQ